MFDIGYTIMQFLCNIVTNLFFKDLTIIGAENIPTDSPVIICGNHANQFLDAVLMMYSVPRKIGFIIAAKSYRKAVIGHLAKAAHAIPVERPQDIAKNGTGRITEIKETTIIGTGTKFTEEVKPGDTLKIKDVALDVIIKQINSDTELTYSTELDISKAGVDLTFKIFPKLDQTGMYDAVWQRLKDNGAVGIFPEGGSHDRTQMLPLKAGVCIMALGAMAKSSAPVKIVPCGFNYFKGYKFRSKAVVEFGVPIEIPKSLVERYQKSKKDAISVLLADIEKRMKSVTISTPTYSDLTAIYTARKLYMPAKYNLKPEEEHLLNRILALGYSELRDDPKVKDFFEAVKQYNHDLRRLRLDDTSVKRISSHPWKNVLNFFISLGKFILSGIFALPGLVLYGPLGLVIKYLSEKERRKALAGSSVKVKGTDVIASHKVLCAIILFPIAAFIWTVAFRLIVSHFCDFKESTLNILTLLFFMDWPIYSYAMILCSDGAVRHYKNMKARFDLLLYRSKMLQLKETRAVLQKRIQAFVDTNARYVIDKVSNETGGEEGAEDMDTLQAGRRNSVEADEALEQAFNILEEIGV